MEIFKYYHCKSGKGETPSEIKTVDEQIEYRMRPYGIKSRTVTLEKGWYHHAVGAMLGTLKEDGSAVALLPDKFSGYRLIDIKTGKQLKMNRKTVSQILTFRRLLPKRTAILQSLPNSLKVSKNQ